MSLASWPSRETQRETQLGPGTWLTKGAAEWLDVAASGCKHLDSIRCLRASDLSMRAGLRLMAPFIEHLLCAKLRDESFISFLSSLHNSTVKIEAVVPWFIEGVRGQEVT